MKKLHTTLQNYTQLYNISTQLYTTLQNNFTKVYIFPTFTKRYKTCQHFENFANPTKFYTIVQSFFFKTIQHFSCLYNSTQLNKTLQDFTQLCTTLQSLYEALQTFYNKCIQLLQHFTIFYTNYTKLYKNTKLYKSLQNITKR